MENEVKQTENKSFRNYRDVVAKIISVRETYIKIAEIDNLGNYISLPQTIFPPYQESIPEGLKADQIIGLKICIERYWSIKYNQWKVVTKYVGSIDILS